MSVYRDELSAARQEGREAHDAMEQWVMRPVDVPSDTPASVLEERARALRSSRERLHRLREEYGDRDDITGALEENETFHRTIGLSIRDKPDAGIEG
ncbi:MAG: hypothetical protein M3R51_00625 [Candidatus Eremiobacteraeota bacterium]|nr:hypothetical protein [Candidatus Eremiobacteraeota bacterium]